MYVLNCSNSYKKFIRKQMLMISTCVYYLIFTELSLYIYISLICLYLIIRIIIVIYSDEIRHMTGTQV